MNFEAESPQSKGGLKRAESLTDEERQESARKAAVARWSSNLPKATHMGTFKLANGSLEAAVLPNTQRVIVQANVLRALGRSRSPKAGTGVMTTAETGGLPFFLQAGHLQPYITDELRQLATPVSFVDLNGQRAVGYDARLLPATAEVYLKLRDDYQKARKDLPAQYARIIAACDTLIRALANVGIIALVDEATGYQDARLKDALQRILDEYLRPNLGAWAKRFPDEFYREMFRLRNWTWKGMSVNRPQVVAKYTNDLVYQRLAPGLLEELESKNPSDDQGKRKARHHQWLTDEVGHPVLDRHVHTVVSFMKASNDWPQFMGLMDRALPKKGKTLQLAF